MQQLRLLGLLAITALCAAAPLAAFGNIGTNFISPTSMEQERLDRIEREAGGGTANIQLSFDVGLNLYQMSGEVTYEGDIGQVMVPATAVDAEQDMGLQQETGYRFGTTAIFGFFKVGASITPDFKLEGDETRPYDITFGNFTFIANRRVESLVEATYVTADVGMIILPASLTGGFFELGAGIAVHGFLDLIMELDGTIVEPTTMLEASRSERAEFPLVPVPSIMIFGGIYPTDSIAIEPALKILKTPDFSGYSEDIEKLEGTLVELSLVGRYFPWDNIGIGGRLAVMTTTINADLDDGNNRIMTDDLNFTTLEISFVLSFAFI